MSGQESVNIFSKSGLGVEVLKKIWKLADHDQDNRLTAKEFCVAFHLIVCVGKQGFAVPHTLPTSFQAFLDNAPEDPTIASTNVLTNSSTPHKLDLGSSKTSNSTSSSSTPTGFSSITKSSMMNSSSNHSSPAGSNASPV